MKTSNVEARKTIDELQAEKEKKEKECLILNSLLGKKQEDLLFALEQLKDMKMWAKDQIAEVQAKAKAEIEKRDLDLARVREAAERERTLLKTELDRRQETLETALADLNRER